MPAFYSADELAFWAAYWATYTSTYWPADNNSDVSSNNICSNKCTQCGPLDVSVYIIADITSP